MDEKGDRIPGWLDLPRSKKKCWFSSRPSSAHWQNYLDIVDEFAVDIDKNPRLALCNQLLVQ